MEKKNISSLLLTDTYRDCRGTPKNMHTYTCCVRTAWISASRLSFSLCLYIFCSVNNDKAMLLLLEISHPALFTDRCHGILATLNCQHLVKHIETWQRFYLSCLCRSYRPIGDVLYIRRNHERHLQSIVADSLEM